MPPAAMRTYASSRPSSAKSKSPKSSRKRTKHPLDLYHLIPPPDSSSDGSGDDAPEPSAKRRKADGGAVPVNASPPSFNSNSIKSAKHSLDYSPIEESSDNDDEPRTFNFSKKGRRAPVSSRFVYDEASESSGEETSIPGTMPPSNTERQGTQKVPGREPSELRETDKAVAESLDQDSEEDLGERSFHAVRSSQVGPPRPESGGSGESEYESAEEAAEARAEESSSSDSEEEAPRASKAAKAGAEESSDASSETQSSSSDSEEPARPQTLKAAKAGAEESSDGSPGAQSSSSDSEDENPQPAASKAVAARVGKRRGESTGEQPSGESADEQPSGKSANEQSSGESAGEQPSGESADEESSGSNSDSNAKPTRKAAKAALAKNGSTSASRTPAQPKVNGNASAKKMTPTKSKTSPLRKKARAPPASASQPVSTTKTSTLRRNARATPASASQPVSTSTPRNKASRESLSNDTPGSQGRLTAREEQTINSTIERFLATQNQFTEEDLPSLVKGEIEDTHKAKRLHERFWNEIYESLPHRTSRYLRAIVKRKHVSYSAQKKWSTEEDKRLVELAKEHDREEKKWLHIGKLLERTPAECRDRYRNYALCGTARTIGVWQAEELRLLLEAISKSVSEDAEAGDRAYDAEHYDVDWMEVSAEMGGRRSRQQCLAKWKNMRVNVNNVRVRQLLHGRQPEVSPQLRIVLMQVYSTPEEGLRHLVSAIATHVSDGDRPIPWGALDEGSLTKDLRLETLNIIWTRLRRGLAKGLRNKSDQECARKIYEDAIEERDLEEVVAQQEDIEFEEGLMSDRWRSLSTRASFIVGKSG